MTNQERREMLLEQWEDAARQLKELKAKEKDLRTQVGDEFFPNCTKEGVNSHPLDNGYVLKFDYKLSRTIDEASLEAVQNKMPIDTLVTFKPSLTLKNYRNLTPDMKKIFDEALITKPGSPTVSIVKAKK